MIKKLLPFLLLLALSTCTRVNQRPSVLTGFNCGDLCWNGITIGKTSSDELLKILSTLPSVDPESIQVAEVQSQGFNKIILFYLSKTGNSQPPLVEAKAWFMNGKLVMLTFKGEFKDNLSDHVQDMVDKFGEPEKVFVSLHPMGIRVVDLINLSNGVRFSIYADDENAVIAPDSETALLQLYDISLSKELMGLGLLTNYQYDPDTDPKGWLHDWTGYGKIAEKYSSTPKP